jgi:hypothetical protein
MTCSPVCREVPSRLAALVSVRWFVKAIAERPKYHIHALEANTLVNEENLTQSRKGAKAKTEDMRFSGEAAS